jgi:DNA-binding LacI/PurR family transcriptional regulator
MYIGEYIDVKTAVLRSGCGERTVPAGPWCRDILTLTRQWRKQGAEVVTGPSMKDVARVAGVSTKTVSNVVRGWPPVSPATSKRVQAALDELGYRMNLSARMLRSGRSGIIALALPWLSSPYFAELTSAVVRIAESKGWTVLIDQTDGLAEREILVIDGIRGHLIDGVIFSPSALGPEEMMRYHGRVPMVLLGERVGVGLNDHVAIDNVSAAFDVVSHLLQIGRRRIAAIGLQVIAPAENARLRAKGYELALRSAHLPVNARLQQPVAAFDRSEGAAALDRLLDQSSSDMPDAVFCFSDLLALGAMHAAHRRGLRIPEDIAIAGFDDIEDGRYSNPPLTTVSPDKEALAAAAVEFLLTRLQAGEEELSPREFVPSYSLEVRASTVGCSFKS